MPNYRHLFTSESVTEGHPDKIADQISDAILDALLAKDPMSRVACETLVTTGLAIVAGEITTTAVIDYQDVVRSTIREIGYDRGKYGYDSGGEDGQGHEDLRQPDGPLRSRRAARRRGRDGPQDHRGHLRGRGAARRGRVLGERPDKGGPLGVLHGAVHREEHRRGGS